MKRSSLSRKTPLKASKGLSRTTRLAKIGKQKPKRAKRYAQYLRSPEWKARRQAELERAGHRCEHLVAISDLQLQTAFRSSVDVVWVDGKPFVRCPNTEKLTVHHLSYAHKGNEQPGELQVLCHPHHMRLHALEGKRVGRVA